VAFLPESYFLTFSSTDTTNYSFGIAAINAVTNVIHGFGICIVCIPLMPGFDRIPVKILMYL